MESAVDDYRSALEAAYPHADYITVNISSPNTQGLRELQQDAHLDTLLGALKSSQAHLTEHHGRYVPLAVKVSPDLNAGQITEMAKRLLAHHVDAVIATNTTVTRPNLHNTPQSNEAGGLSGRPLKNISTNNIRNWYDALRGQIPIIGVGGIENSDDAWEKMVAGADLLQIYTALIYQGPCVIKFIVEGLVERVRASGAVSLADAVARARLQSTNH